MELNVNGNRFEIDPLPGEMLSDMLRERLHLTGIKIGCNEAECGACTVLINGEPVSSCTYPSAKAAGKHIITIEGLAELSSSETSQAKSVAGLHPLQESFIQYGAVQCGFCIPGQIMTAYTLLQRNPDPDDGEIRAALKDTLCRCAGYPAIISSVKAAAKSLRTHTAVAGPHSMTSSNPLEVVGRMQVRPDSVAKVTGSAIYSDDIKFPGMLHARVKRAGVSHAFLRSLDVSKARQLEGVVSVLTAQDIPGENNHGLVVYDWPVLVGVGERVRYVGDAVAMRSGGESRACYAGIGISRRILRYPAMSSRHLKEERVEVAIIDVPDVEVSTEVDVRGMRVHEVDEVVVQALDAAIRADLQSLRIIHGKGTGALRERVNQMLKREKRVKSFRLGAWNEGGAGVTVAEFK